MCLLLALIQVACPPDDERTIRIWIEALGCDDVNRRDEAYQSLKSLGESVFPLLRQFLRAPDPEVRARCRALMRGVEFEPGAWMKAGVGREVPDVRADPELKMAFEALALSGSVAAIMKEDWKWLTCAMDGLLSDEKPVIEASLRFLHLVIWRRVLFDMPTALQRRVDFKAFQSAESRAEEYTLWAQWWFTKSARDLAFQWSEEKPNAAKEQWEETLGRLRELQGFEDPSSGESQILERVRLMGGEAYSSLVFYVDHEDIAIGKSALLLLTELTGRKERPLTRENKYDLRAEWLAWLRSER